MALSFIQGAGNTTGGATSLATSFVSNVTVNNRIVIAVTVYYLTTNPIASITDNLGNTYSLVATVDTYGFWTLIYSAPVATGGACTVTVNLIGYPQVALSVSEFSGISTIVDITNTANGYSATPQVGGTTTAETILFGAVCGNWSSSPTITPDSGWTQIYENENWATMVISFIYRIGATSSYTAGWTLSSDQYWICALAAYKEVAGGAKFPVPHLYWSEEA